MAFILAPWTSLLPKLTPTAVVDILLVAFLIYELLTLVRGRRSAHILGGIGILVLLYLVSIWANLELLRTLLSQAAPYFAFALIVLFQSDIRRTLARLGRSRLFSMGSRLQYRESIAEILLALSRLSQQQVGALIVMERDIGLRTFIESGVIINGALSRDLLLSIFQPGGALHDGAVIVQKDKIAAAACFLPLSMNPIVSRKLGTRHRAAIGITEESDCLALVVSEETGRISAAAFGDIEVDLTLTRAEERMVRHFGRRKAESTPPREGAPEFTLEAPDETDWGKSRQP
jgi:diadenylate cyclase